MSECDQYNPDNVFKRFKVIEFPVSFVGLSTERYLDVETNLARDSYLKTTCYGSLLKFDEARDISPSHRAFYLEQVDNRTIKITFKPINECICHTKNIDLHDNKFIFDLRLIKVNGERCCNNEFHSEIGRYYISGQYEYCELSHHPKVVDFGDVVMNTEKTKSVIVKNESNFNAARIESIKITGFDVLPCKFVIPANSSKRLKITCKPTSLVMKSTLIFKVRNPHSIHDDSFHTEHDQNIKDDNLLPYSISCKTNVIYQTKKTNLVVESLHKLVEPDIRYTFVDEITKNQQKEHRKVAYEYLQLCKSNYSRKPKVVKMSTGKVKCYPDIIPPPRRLPKHFCKPVIQRIDTYALFDVVFLPHSLDFGKIACQTYGMQELILKNNSQFDITIQFHKDSRILYTNEKLATLSMKLNQFSETKITVLCLGYVAGMFQGTFDYMVDNKFCKKHKYFLQVENPVLRIQDYIIKFGMITSESFITSVPVKIYNDFNVPVEYKWDEFNSDAPFDIIPSSGSIPEHSYRMCDVIYICKLTKTKTHEINFISEGNTTRVIPIELNVITRKLTVKFIQQAIIFKDIALNIETIERAKLENSSREIASFFVVEPLLPGVRVEPMSGNIRPKMMITFEIIVKISCVLEFAFDILVKINNKENVSLPVSGNVVEPRIIIHPKNIFLTRIPCGMVTYVPVTFQNSGPVKTFVEVLDTGDDNMFDVYTIVQGNEKQRIYEFCVDSGQSKIVFIKVLDVFRREYDMFIPFKINGLLGPPDEHSWSMELQHYIGEYEAQYENNLKVKMKYLNKDIGYCRIMGVITVSWIEFSVDKFEIDYVPNGNNKIEFTMKNISKYYLYVTIVTSKLSPIFTLDINTENNTSIVNENNIKFELSRDAEVELTLKFHPKMHGRYVSTAIFFLDKHMAVPYSNLTFIGKRLNPVMTPSTYRVSFPPCYVGTSMARILTVQMGFVANLDQFSCYSKDEPNLYVTFLSCEIFNPESEDDELYTVLTVEIRVTCKRTYARYLILTINHECGSGCEIEIIFCFTHCVLTLHTHLFVKPDHNPYPYYPLSTQTELYEYMETCTQFLEKWMFQQGFRRDLYPEIPNTFHAISTFLSSQIGTKTKCINVTFLSFMKRIAGPMMKHIRKANAHGVDESFKCVKEIHDTYQEILSLLRTRGSDLWILEAKFLLSYDQFVIYSEFVTPKCNADILLTRELLGDVNLFNRLSKQSWIDIILQSYKVFIMNSCFFDCLCVSNEARDIVRVLVDWFNSHIILQHNKLLGEDIPIKEITNLTTDLTDGIALASAILTYCPFMSDQFEMLSNFATEDREAGIINNACLIIEAMNLLRLYFPISSTDFLKPNFLQMLFLSIHFYVVLPMFSTKDIITFKPPLLRSSTRALGVYPATQESLTFNFVLLNNYRNNFTVEKVPLTDNNGKKMFLNVKYTANFVAEESCILLVHGYNKTRIFDTYIIFILKGGVGALYPTKKCKVTGPLYRPVKVDITVPSPFLATAKFKVHITDCEPTIPVEFKNISKPKFYVCRLHLIDKEVVITPCPKDNADNNADHKMYLQLLCLSTTVGTSWIWFRSEIGEFFIRVTTQPRWDIAVDTLQANVETWPMDPCSCGEACECYRTTVLSIPHRNDLMVKALRYSLLEFASEIMMQIFERLIETTTGKLILDMLLQEGGTNMSEVKHILRSEIRYNITSKTLQPRFDKVEMAHHTSAILLLPVTLPFDEKQDKYSVTFTSECGMDIRTYKIICMQSNYNVSLT